MKCCNCGKVIDEDEPQPEEFIVCEHCMIMMTANRGERDE